MKYLLFIFRNQIVQEIENEDEHRKWYYEQMENIKHKMEVTPVSDQVSTTAYPFMSSFFSLSPSIREYCWLVMMWNGTCLSYIIPVWFMAEPAHSATPQYGGQDWPIKLWLPKASRLTTNIVHAVNV